MKKKEIFVIIVIVCLISNSAVAQLKFTPSKEQRFSIPKNEVIDIGFELKKSIKKPFLVDFGAVFIGPNGQELTVPGFYNGNEQWILRFSAKTMGEWKFTSYSTIKALDNKTGEIKVSEERREKHGGITICEANTQKFCYEDGTPYMLQAFELDWLFALDYNNPKATPKSDHFLSLLAENGINQIVTTVYSYDIKEENADWTRDELLKKYPEHEFGAKDEIYPFLGTNNDPDFSALNVTFFQRFDRMISLMDRHDIVAHLMIYVWNKKVNWPGAETEADNMYFDYIIKRYQAFPNVIWDISKEALNNKRCTEAYGRERINRIDSLDAYDRLVSVHDYGFCKRNSDIVDFISTQNWNSRIYTEMLKVHKEFEKPVFNIEHGGYELSPYKVFPGGYENPEYCLRRNYLCYFAGAYATYYWQGAAWNVIIPNPFQQSEDFIKPKFAYYKHLEAFFERVKYEQFEPYPQANQTAYCLKTNDDNTYLFFLPKETYQLPFYHKTGAGKAVGTFQWFNTYTGEYTDEMEYQGGAMKAPWSNIADAILIRKLK